MFRRATGAVLATLLTAHPLVLTAQNALGWRDSAVRLSKALVAAQDSAERRDSALVEAGRSGRLVISSTPELVAPAREALRRFVELRARWFGQALPVPGGFRIVLRTGSDWYIRGERPGRNTVALAGLPDSSGSFHVSLGVSRTVLASPDRLAPRLLKEYGQALFTHGDTALRRWLVSEAPLDTPEAERRQEVMYDLVTGAGLAQRRCVRGDLAECAFALELRSLHSPDPAQRYNALLRSDLYLFALELGGPDAWTRLTNASGAPVEQQLAAAAGMPADSLLSRWRSGVLALKPLSGVLDWRGGLAVLGWSALLALAALGGARWV